MLKLIKLRNKEMDIIMMCIYRNKSSARWSQRLNMYTIAFVSTPEKYLANFKFPTSDFDFNETYER
jgi:hypothetical protein